MKQIQNPPSAMQRTNRKPRNVPLARNISRREPVSRYEAATAESLVSCKRKEEKNRARANVRDTL